MTQRDIREKDTKHSDFGPAKVIPYCAIALQACYRHDVLMEVREIARAEQCPEVQTTENE
jgi:hypothetical protein